MKIYRDIETGEILTAEQLQSEYNELKENNCTECETFESYLTGCLEKGSLERWDETDGIIKELKDAHEPYLVQLIQTMANAKQHIDNTIWAECNDDPTIDDIQLVIAGKHFNIGSFHTDVVDLVWHLLDDVQKYAASEIV